MQNRHLLQIARDQTLWESHCLSRWPGLRTQPGCIACQSEQAHATDWVALYTRRAGMPTAFPLACDSVRACTAGGPLPGSGPRSEAHGDFARILCWTHTIMLCCEGCEDVWLRGGQIGSQGRKACVSLSVSSEVFNPIKSHTSQMARFQSSQGHSTVHEPRIFPILKRYSVVD